MVADVEDSQIESTMEIATRRALSAVAPMENAGVQRVLDRRMNGSADS